jgi:hypothetical protein
MKRSLIPTLVCLCGLIPTTACTNTEGASVGRIELALSDTAVLAAVERFRVYIFRGTTTAGTTLSCDDFPEKYRIDDLNQQHHADLVTLAQSEIAWNGGSSEPSFERIAIDADVPLLIIIHGVSQPAPGQIVAVAHGCATQSALAAGAAATVSVDARATAGRGCVSQAQCEVGLECHRDSGCFSNGYCTTTGCAEGTACLPGSTCSTDDTVKSGICLRNCNNTQDCDAALQQDCFQPSGVAGDQLVCVHTFFHKTGGVGNCQ